MPVETIARSATGIDLSPRVVSSSTVAASPAASAETIIATITLPSNVAVVAGVQLTGWAAFTVGTNGVGATLRLRQTNASGSVIASTGATTVVAANLGEASVQGFDSSAAAGQVYVLTLQVASGSASSTVSGCQLMALIV